MEDLTPIHTRVQFYARSEEDSRHVATFVGEMARVVVYFVEKALLDKGNEENYRTITTLMYTFWNHAVQYAQTGDVEELQKTAEGLCSRYEAMFPRDESKVV